MDTNKAVYDSKDLVSLVPGPRKYYLSVRLNEEDLMRYSAILDYYKLGPAHYQGNRSDRFRELLEEFHYGLLEEDVQRHMLIHLGVVTRPPLWKRDHNGT